MKRYAAVQAGGVSVAQFLVYQYHRVPAAGRVAQKVYMVADALGRVAVVACAVGMARGVDVEAGRVDGCCGRSCPCQRGLCGLAHLVHARHHNNMFWTEGNGGHAVARAVYVHNHPVFAKRVNAADVEVGSEGHAVYLLRLLACGHGVAVVQGVSPRAVQCGGKPHIAYGHRSAPRYAAAFGYEFQYQLNGLCRCLAEVRPHVAAFQMLYDLGRQFLVSCLFRCHVSIGVCGVLFAYLMQR